MTKTKHYVIINSDQTEGDELKLSDKMKNAVKSARSAYQREWRKKNPTKTKEYNNRYWERRVMREQMQEKENWNHGDNKTISDD